MEKNKIIKIIKKLRKKKYQNCTLNNKQIKIIKKIKKNIITSINFKSDKYKIPHEEQKFIRNDNTHLVLQKLYNKKNKKISEYKIYRFYKKYNINLCLKSNYDNKFKSLTKKNTNFLSYIFLGLLIKPNKKINSLQILNTILKINDHIISESNQIKYIFQKNLFKKLLLKEQKYFNLIKKI